MKTSEAIEEQGDTTVVGMFSHHHLFVIDGLWGCFDKVDMVATRAMQSVQTRQCPQLHTEMFI